MSQKRILLLMVICALIISFLCLILPTNTAQVYSSILLPVALLIGFIFALQVASIYQKELKRTFLFLAFFLIIYTLVNIDPLWNLVRPLLTGNNVLIIPIVQIVNFSMLLISCVYTVKVMQVKRMNWIGWLFFCLVLVLAIIILAQDIAQTTAAIPLLSFPGIIKTLITIIDMAVVLMLVPVLFLYIQNSQARAQESITFTLIVCGVIISLLADYILKLIFGPSYYSGANIFILNTAYLFGYSITAIGLYAHMKWNDWGFKMIERALG